MTIKKKLVGIIPAVATPFKKFGDLDEQTLRKNLRFLIESGVNGLMVNGSTGEGANLSRLERSRIIKVAVEETEGKLPVIASTGTPSTSRTIELTKDAKSAGADAVMIVTPFYLIPNEYGLIKHYHSISQSIDIPIVVYNIPQHTNVNISPDAMARICEDVPAVAALKESSGDMLQLAEKIELIGDRISVLTGSEGLLLQSFVVGADGAIVAIGNIAPSQILEMFNAVKEQKIQRAKEIYFRLLPIAKAISNEVNFPAGVKEAVKLLGRSLGPPRNPIVPVTEEERTEIEEALKYSGLI
jgi:4-hydroxy-tetrahydrodipicolinate synthase